MTSGIMSEPSLLQYALVAYVRNTLGQFVEELRRELHPAHAHLPAHVTVLPPRLLLGSESEALAMLNERCALVKPFEVGMGEVASFVPTTPTVFVRVAHAAYRLRELHDLLNSDVLICQEALPYMPHMTIGKMDSMERAREVYEISSDRWDHFQGPHRFLVEELSFVRGSGCEWHDLATVTLGVGRKS